MNLHIPPPENTDDHDNQGNYNVESAKAPTLSRWLQNKETRKGEILWALKCVLSHYSFKYNEDTSPLFAHIFWDSNIAKNYSLCRTKLAYLVTFGLAPSFREMLAKSVRQSNCCMIIFDESFNELFQLDQMDVLVWKADKVMMRY